jgi:F-type H+-transporting ATPase subunit b
MSDRTAQGAMGPGRWTRITMGVALGLVPAVVWAASGGHEEIESPFTLFLRIVNFLLLAGLLYYLLNKPVRNFLNQRQQGVKEALEEAERARDEANARYREMERKLGQAQREMEELKKMLLEQGRVEKERILVNAQKEADRIRRQAELTAEQEYKQAQHLLRREAVDLAARLAEAILKERIEPKDHDRLIRDYVETVGKTA